MDVLSRRAFAYVLKSGQMRDVLDAYGLFLDDVSDVHSVTGDNFFNNRQFKLINASTMV